MYRIPNLTPGEYVVVAPMVPVTVPASSQGGGNRPNLQATSQALSGGSPIPGAGGQALGPDNRFLLQRSNGMSGDIAAAMDASGRITASRRSTTPTLRQPQAHRSLRWPRVRSAAASTWRCVACRQSPFPDSSPAPTGRRATMRFGWYRRIPGEIVQEPETAVAMSDASAVLSCSSRFPRASTSCRRSGFLDQRTDGDRRTATCSDVRSGWKHRTGFQCRDAGSSGRPWSRCSGRWRRCPFQTLMCTACP